MNIKEAKFYNDSDKFDIIKPFKIYKNFNNHRNFENYIKIG